MVKGIENTTRDAINRLVVQAQSEGWATKKLVDRIVADYAFSPERAMVIARTEDMRASSAGKIESWRASAKVTGLIYKKRVVLGLNENHCAVCRSAVVEGAIPIDEEWSAGFMPPFHPSCYCAIVPMTERPTALEKAFNPSQARGKGGKWVSDGGGYNAAREIARGRTAIAGVLASHHDAIDAMHARGLGPVSFVWGTPGKGKSFRGGRGLSHVIAKRATEGNHDLTQRIPEILAHGKGGPDDRGGYVFEHGGDRVVLVRGNDGPPGHWMLTAYVKK
jgi:hypothetical protein